MRSLSVQEILTSTKGKTLSQTTDQFTGIGTDTRADLTGQLFIALKGESFDAHDFLTKAVDQGAAGLLVHKETSELQQLRARTTVILVDDTLLALQAMGQAARRASKAKVIGITGSNGKTTTKEFTAAVMSHVRNVHYSKGSFNNHWGVPFTLLQIRPEHEIAVVEMGMNHAGEITELVKIAEPDVVACTMVGRAHIEHFGSVEAVAAAKEEIYEAASADAVRVYFLDNPWTKAMFDRAATRFPKAKRISCSSTDTLADVHLKITELTMRDLTLQGSLAGVRGTAKIPVFGAHNLSNLMIAAANALAAGLSPDQVWKGLPECRTAWGRNQFVQLKSGAEMIFDAYNANPDSMNALIENMPLVKTQGRKIGVFGQMRELGDFSPGFHEELGQSVAGAGFDAVFFIGPDLAAFRKGLSQGQYKGKFQGGDDYADELGKALSEGLQSGDIVVVKGSRGMKLERFVTPCQPLDFSPK